MATQQPALSAGVRWRLGITICFLILSIPAAALFGNQLGSELMQGLKDQLVPTTGDASVETASAPFSPYGIAHSGQSAPGKSAWGDLDADDVPPEPQPDTDPSAVSNPKILEEAPRISVEPIISQAPPPVDPVAAEPEAAPSRDPNSIFSVEDPQPKKKKAYRIVLGTFASEENAQALVQDLLLHGYEPFIETKEATDGATSPQYRVLIGSFSDAADAGAVAEELRRLGYNAWLNEKT